MFNGFTKWNMPPFEFTCGGYGGYWFWVGGIWWLLMVIGWWLGGHCEVIGWLLISGSWGLLMVIGCQCHPTFEFRNHWDVMGKKRTPRIQSQPKGGKPKLVGSIPFDSFGSQLWISILDLNFLVAGFNLPLWKIYEFVSWDDEIYEIPNWMESHKIHDNSCTKNIKTSKSPIHPTTHQVP